jgi:hypothetical protein
MRRKRYSVPLALGARILDAGPLARHGIGWRSALTLALATESRPRAPTWAIKDRGLEADPDLVEAIDAGPRSTQGRAADRDRRHAADIPTRSVPIVFSRRGMARHLDAWRQGKARWPHVSGWIVATDPTIRSFLAFVREGESLAAVARRYHVLATQGGATLTRADARRVVLDYTALVKPRCWRMKRGASEAQARVDADRLDGYGAVPATGQGTARASRPLGRL